MRYFIHEILGRIRMDNCIYCRKRFGFIIDKEETHIAFSTPSMEQGTPTGGITLSK